MAAPVEVEFRATGVDGVQRSLRLVRSEIEATSKATEGMSHSAAIGLSELSRGFGRVAQAGQMGAFSMREFTGAAFRLGSTLGADGIGVAIGMAVIAIGTLTEYFGKAGEATKKANEEFTQYIETLAHGSVVAASLEKAKLYSGDPMAMITGRREGESDIAFHARAGGQLFLESEKNRLQAQFDALEATVRTRPHGEMTARESSDWSSLVGQLKEIDVLLKQNDFNLARVSGVYDELIKKEKELAAFQLSQWQSKTGEAHEVTLGFGLQQREDFQAAMLRQYRAGLMGDQINALGFGPKGDKANYVGSLVGGFKIKPADLPRDIFAEAQGEILKQWNASMRSMQDTMVGGIAGTLSTALSDAFTGSWKGIGRDAKAGLGGIISDMGGILVQFGTTMLPLSKIFSTNPLTAGLEAISIGILLEGLGKALGKAAYGGGSGGYSAGAVASSASAIAGGGSVTVVIPKGGSFLNPNDPALMAEFVDALRKAFGNRNVTIQELS